MTPNDVKIVADNINDFIDVPEGMNRLRKAVLTLAVSGQLVEQNENEGTVDELYAQVKAEHDKIEEVSRKKNTKKLHPITDKEVPFDIPKTWKWVRLCEVAEINGGYAFKSQNFKDQGVRVIKISDFDENGFKESKIVRHDYDSTLAQFEINNENILLCMTGGTVGKSYFVKNINEKMVTNQRVATIKINRQLVSEFINCVILSPYIQKCIKDKKNSTNDNISMDDIKSFIIPMPPYAEQERIVEKVQTVMKQLDELESKKNERDLVRSRLARSAMQALGFTDSKIAFEQLTELIKTSQDIKELENAILTLAISGKLVSQDEGEETADNLYEKIIVVRRRQNKKVKTLPPIEPEEMSIKLPESWKWVRLGEIASIGGGKRLPKGDVLTRTPTDHIYIRVSDMKNGSIDESDIHYITPETFQKIKNYTISENDIYMTIVGATIGKNGIVPNRFNNMNLTENAAKVSPYLVDKKYLQKAFDSNFCQNQFFDKTKQVGVQKMALQRFANTLIPLPPLAEQKRIVKKVEELTILINQLKNVIA